MINQDITKANYRTDKLLGSEETFRAQYRGIPVPTFTWKKVARGRDNFVLIACNDAAIATTKGKVVHYVGKTAKEMRQNRPDILENLKSCYDKKTPIERYKSGKSKHLSVKYAYVPPDLILVNTEDITQLWLTELALEEQTIRNQVILKTALDGFYVMSVKGKILETNHAASRISGYPIEDLIGTNISDFDTDDTRQKRLEHVKRAMERGADRFEARQRRRDGRLVDLTFSTNFVELCQRKFLFSFFHDITERKRAFQSVILREKELKLKSRSLEKLNAALEIVLEKRDKDKRELEEKVFFNTKELVIPYLEKLKKSGLDKKQKAYLHVIESNLDHIISAFSRRLCSAELDFTPAEIRVANLVRHGKTTKEIAEFLNLSVETISSHRESIRGKLRIKNKKANLRTHLLSIQ